MQVDQGTKEWFPIQKGVRKGCILSPGLFNPYSEFIIKREVSRDPGISMFHIIQKKPNYYQHIEVSSFIT